MSEEYCDEHEYMDQLLQPEETEYACPVRTSSEGDAASCVVEMGDKEVSDAVERRKMEANCAVPVSEEIAPGDTEKKLLGYREECVKSLVQQEGQSSEPTLDPTLPLTATEMKDTELSLTSQDSMQDFQALNRELLLLNEGYANSHQMENSHVFATNLNLQKLEDASKSVMKSHAMSPSMVLDKGTVAIKATVGMGEVQQKSGREGEVEALSPGTPDSKIPVSESEEKKLGTFISSGGLVSGEDACEKPVTSCEQESDSDIGSDYDSSVSCVTAGRQSSPELHIDTETDTLVTQGQDRAPSKKLPKGTKRKSEEPHREQTQKKKKSPEGEIPVEILGTLDETIDMFLEEKAIRNNLTAVNVKNIIRHVMTNDYVLKMVKNTMKPDSKSESDSEDDGTTVFEPTLTRAKTKELLEKKKPIPWPITPVKKMSSQSQMLIEQEFPEDEEGDEEYKPSHEEQSEDDDSYLSSHASDIASPTPSTPMADQVPDTPFSPQEASDSQVFKVPQTTLKQCPTNPDKQETDNIGLRTRSKLPLNDTPLEQIEMAFLPPDITTDMYDFECDDEDWTDFLKGFSFPLNAETLNDNCDDDEADPEYNVLEDEEETNDQEELRVDRAVKISKKELNELMAELFEATEGELLSSDEDEACSVQSRPSRKVSSRQKKPLQETTPEEEGENCTDNLSSLSEEESIVAVKRELYLELSESQKRQLEEHMRKHVQLLTQVYLLSSLQKDLGNISDLCKSYLLELQSLATGRWSCSVFAAYNLPAAMDVVTEWETHSEERNARILKNAANPRKKNKRGSVRFSEDLVDVMKKSWVFMYPELLPQIPFPEQEPQRFLFTKSEDQLIAMGLEQFIPYISKRSPAKTKRQPFLLQGAVEHINKLMITSKTEQQIRIRIKNMRNSKASEENPIKYYFLHNISPEVPKLVQPFDPTLVKAPEQQPPEALPQPWRRIIYPESETSQLCQTGSVVFLQPSPPKSTEGIGSSWSANPCSTSIPSSPIVVSPASLKVPLCNYRNNIIQNVHKVEIATLPGIIRPSYTSTASPKLRRATLRIKGSNNPLPVPTVVIRQLFSSGGVGIPVPSTVISQVIPVSESPVPSNVRQKVGGAELNSPLTSSQVSFVTTVMTKDNLSFVHSMPVIASPVKVDGTPTASSPQPKQDVTSSKESPSSVSLQSQSTSSSVYQHHGATVTTTTVVCKAPIVSTKPYPSAKSQTAETGKEPLLHTETPSLAAHPAVTDRKDEGLSGNNITSSLATAPSLSGVEPVTSCAALPVTAPVAVSSSPCSPLTTVSQCLPSSCTLTVRASDVQPATCTVPVISCEDHLISSVHSVMSTPEKNQLILCHFPKPFQSGRTWGEKKVSPMKQISPILKKYSPRKMKKTGGNIENLKKNLSPMKVYSTLCKPGKTIHRPLAPKPPAPDVTTGQEEMRLEPRTDGSTSLGGGIGCGDTARCTEASALDPVEEPGESDHSEGEGEPEEEEMEEEEQDNLEDLAALMLASSTIRRSPRAKPATPNLVKKKSKHQRDLESTLAMLAPEEYVQTEKSDTDFARAYFAKVKDIVEAKDSGTYHHFLRVLSEFGQKSHTAVELYDKISLVLQKYPELADEFVGFLLPEQALQCGRYAEHLMITRMREFLRKLQTHFQKHPQQIQKIIRRLSQFTKKTDVTVTEVKRSILPLLRGNCHLIDEFLQLFPEEKPPESWMTDFEELDYPDSDQSYHSGDDMETIHLPEEDDPFGGDKCPCQCHNSDNPKYSTRVRHCVLCGTKFLDGKVYVQSGRVLRPAKIVYRYGEPCNTVLTSKNEKKKETGKKSDKEHKLSESSPDKGALQSPVLTNTGTGTDSRDVEIEEDAGEMLSDPEHGQQLPKLSSEKGDVGSRNPETVTGTPPSISQLPGSNLRVDGASEGREESRAGNGQAALGPPFPVTTSKAKPPKGRRVALQPAPPVSHCAFPSGSVFSRDTEFSSLFTGTKETACEEKSSHPTVLSVVPSVSHSKMKIVNAPKQISSVTTVSDHSEANQPLNKITNEDVRDKPGSGSVTSESCNVFSEVKNAITGIDSYVEGVVPATPLSSVPASLCIMSPSSDFPSQVAVHGQASPESKDRLPSMASKVTVACDKDDTQMRQASHGEAGMEEEIVCRDESAATLVQASVDWTREEDRIILETCRLEGSSEQTLRNISRKIPPRTSSEVATRFHELISLFRQMSGLDSREESTDSSSQDSTASQ